MPALWAAVLPLIVLLLMVMFTAVGSSRFVVPNAARIFGGMVAADGAVVNRHHAKEIVDAAAKARAVAMNGTTVEHQYITDQKTTAICQHCRP